MAPIFRVEAELHSTATVDVQADDEESAMELGMELIENDEGGAEILDGSLWLNTGVTELDD
jgi:hypothetical protein